MLSLFRLWPFYTLAHNNLATVVEDGAEAEGHLKIALSIDPGHANSRYNIALLLRYHSHLVGTNTATTRTLYSC